MARCQFGLERACFINRLADHVHDAAQRFRTDRNHDGRARIKNFLAAHQAFGRVHGNGAHRAFAQMLRHFEHQAVAAIGGFQRVQDLRQVAFELHVDDGARDLRDAANEGPRILLMRLSSPCLSFLL